MASFSRTPVDDGNDMNANQARGNASRGKSHKATMTAPDTMGPRPIQPEGFSDFGTAKQEQPKGGIV